ncbi:MAG TPA: response regulator [Caulobacteraceae bacterium]|nr:response regulator [Caulobacteraceae bacterium]
MNAQAGGIALLALLVGLAAGAAIAAWFIHRKGEQRRGMVAVMHSEASRQRAMFEAAPEGIMTFDREGRILNANPAAHRLFGYSPGALIGELGAVTLDPADHERALENMTDPAHLAAGGFRTEYRGRRADGEVFPLQVAMTYSPPAEDWFALVFLRDISRQRDAEKLKDEFVSTVSHELRTPLTSIAGSLGLIAGGAVGALPEKAARLIAIAQSNSQRLVRLINDVLDMEKLASGSLPFHMTTTNLREVAGRSIEATRGYAEQLGVELVLEGAEDGLDVRGDPDRLVQVITNLLGNAAKYSPRGGRVRVIVNGDGSTVKLSVSDRGPGVPEAFRDRIFTRFAQADASDARGKSGTGLGLYIAKEIAERHGGRLWFESPPEGGATFNLELPALAEQPTRPSATDRILLVEDEPAAAAILSAILEDDGLKVDVAGTLAEARGFLSDYGRYGAIVLDLRLPDGDGVDLVKEIRAKPDLAPTPIVVVSADARRGKDPGVRMLEVADWMEKPVDPDRLTELVRSALDRVSGESRMILHVDDDRDIREVVATALSDFGEVVSADGLQDAREIIARRMPSLIILDLELRDGQGMDILDDLGSLPAAPPVIVFSAQDAQEDLGPNVVGVLVKSRTPLNSLVEAVQDVLAPEKVFAS